MPLIKSSNTTASVSPATEQAVWSAKKKKSKDYVVELSVGLGGLAVILVVVIVVVIMVHRRTRVNR